jgi:SOS response regulatory protein OraA/RecX
LEIGLQTGEIDEACAERIADASGVCRAYVKGLTSLSYGDQSVRGLTYKLVQKGCSKMHAELAVQMLAQAGYLREDSAALREAERSVAKHRSRRRVEYDLQAKGYDARGAEVQCYLDEVDFDEICLIALRQQCRHGMPEGEQRKKLYQLDDENTGRHPKHTAGKGSQGIPNAGREKPQRDKHHHIAGQIDHGMADQIRTRGNRDGMDEFLYGAERNQIDVILKPLPIGPGKVCAKTLTKQQPEHKQAI